MVFDFLVMVFEFLECIWEIGWIAFFLYYLSMIPVLIVSVLAEAVFNIKISDAWAKRMQGLLAISLTMYITYLNLLDMKPSMVILMIVLIGIIAVIALLCDLSIINVSAKINNKKDHLQVKSKTCNKKHLRFQQLKKNNKRQSSQVKSIVTLPFDLEPRVYSTYGELLLPTLKGDFVRSRNEQLIADKLYQAAISYQYEKTIVLENIECHPDFIVVRPLDGKTFYWEHCGMMNIPEYRSKWERKKLLYKRNNIIEGDNLIITYNQISEKQVQKIIDSILV